MEERSNWQQVFSKTKQRFYWFNQATGKTQWTEPAGHNGKVSGQTSTSSSTGNSNGQDINVEDRNNKRKRDETTNSEDNGVGRSGQTPTSTSSLPTTTTTTRTVIQLPKVAIIVPYRDLHTEQKRAEHLARFIPEMSRYCYYIMHHNIYYV